MTNKKELQTIQLEKTLIDEIKEVAAINGRTLRGEVRYAMMQHNSAVKAAKHKLKK